MILRPQLKDLQIVGFYLGKMVLGMAVFMVIPIGISLLAREINPFYDFLISFLFCLCAGMLLYMTCYTKKEPQWSHGMIVISLAWFLAALIGAIPLFLSGHWGSFLDAAFDAMSGLSTTGLILVQDQAHLSYGHQIWRHLLAFIGGQGIVVVVLTFFIRGGSGAFRLYVGEARDERLLPNVRRTAQFIWAASFLYLILGTLALGLVAFSEGIPFWKAMFHGACIFMAAFDTAGFAPQSQNIMYYHSLGFEIVTMVIMILGALNFRLHYAVWSGDRREIWRNIETRTFFVVIMLLFGLVVIGLNQAGLYPSPLAVFRKGFYPLLSAETGTGFQTVYSSQFTGEWNNLSLVGLILAMSLGGCICSTAGAIKMLRIGVIAKTFMADIKRYIAPESAVFVERLHHIKEMILTETQMRSACLMTIAYVVVYLLGAVVGTLCGYPFIQALFESTSAAGNVGLSCGITQPTMPAVLKITYIILMWAGRLEFMSIFVLAGSVMALIKGK